MDVQAILDGSDESSSGGDNYSYPRSSFSVTEDIVGHVDLEQILREDDDDDDEDDMLKVWQSRNSFQTTGSGTSTGTGTGTGTGTSAKMASAATAGGRSSVAMARETSISALLNGGRGGNGNTPCRTVLGTDETSNNRKMDRKLVEMDDDGHSRPVATNSPNSSKLFLSTVSSSAAHSAEDWAVLQALLNEGEDDDDDYEMDAWIRPSPVTSHQTAAYASASGTSNHQRQEHQLGVKQHTKNQRNQPLFQAKKQQQQNRTNVDVEAILLSEDDDDDEGEDDETDIDVNTMDTDFVVAAAHRHRQKMKLSPDRITSTINGDSDNNIASVWSSPTLDQAEVGAGNSKQSIQRHGIQKSEVEIAEESEHHLMQYQPPYFSGTSDKNASNNRISIASTSRQELSEADEEAMSNRALSHAQIYERKLLKSGQRDIVSPLMVKRRLKQKIELGTRMQKKILQQDVHHRIAPTPITRFNFSNVVETRNLDGISTDLQKMKEKLAKKNISIPEIGLPTAIAVNSKFIAVGTQGGIIFVFDLFEVLRQVLVASIQDDWGLKDSGSITSVDLHMNDEVLVAGHTSGILVLWDTIKGVMLRSVTDAHPSPITSVRFLSELKMVTVDAGGLVNKLTFSKNMLWTTYSMETECLLDGTAGQILAMNVLPPISTVSQHLVPQSLPALFRQLVLIALSSERSSFAVAVEPSVNVLHRWARPPLERIQGTNGSDITKNDQTYLPCLSWGWALVSGGGNKVSAILARAWGCCIQLLIANFPMLEDTPTPIDNGNITATGEAQIHWPAFGVHDEFEVTDPVVALEWLNDRSLVYLTVTSEFTVVDTVMMTLLERLDFSGLKLVYAEFSLSRSSSTGGTSSASTEASGVGNSEDRKSKYCTTFQNSIRSSDERLLVLCQEELKFISIVGAKKRIASLEEDGEWLEALAVALDHYENTISSQEDRRRDPAGKKDLSRHPEFVTAKSEDEEWISRLLLRYLHLAVENAPEPSSSTMNHHHHQLQGEAKIDLAQSHFQMLAGVCVEFCVVTRRLDLLFGPIFRRFRFVGYTSVFLDVLEPYVLTDKLNYIAPEAMTYFVEHCKATNGIATVERCLLHMDVTIMDFDSILTLLRTNQMYSALFYVFNQGLDDYITPLEVLLDNIFDAADEGCARLSRRRDGLPQNDFERLGYKAILYLRTCFKGKTFPQELSLQPEERLGTLRAEILRFLLREKYAPFSPNVCKKTGTGHDGHRSIRYPYAHILLMVDARAVLDAISLALDAPGVVFARSESNFEAVAGGWEVEVGVDTASEHGTGLHVASTTPYSFDDGDNFNRDANNDNNISDNDDQDYLEKSLCPDMQRIIGMLTCIIIPEETDSKNDQVGLSVHKSKTAVNAFLDFISRYMLKRIVRVSKFVTYMILNRMAELYTASNDNTERQAAQRQIIDLLNALPRNSYEADDVLKLMERSGIHRAALLLHQEGASWHYSDKNDPEVRSQHFSSAIDCYLEDDDPLFRLEVFAYVKKECSGISEEDDDGNLLPSYSYDVDQKKNDTKKNGDTPSTLRNALAVRLPEFVHLDALKTAELVAELFVEDLDRVVKLLDAADDRGDSQFMFFQTIISGSLNDINPVAAAVLNANLAMEHHHKYLALMARLHPDMVYEYLSTHDNYRPEECLKLCQRHEIADASAYLLERMGNVSSALQLILQTLESRMMALKRTIRGMGLELFRQHAKRHNIIRSHTSNTSDVGASITTSSSPFSVPTTPLALQLSPTGTVPAGFSSKQEKEVEGVKRILIVALDLCERNSGTFSAKINNGGASHYYYRQNDQHGGSQLWFNVLDRLINAKGFLRLSKEQQEHAEVMADVLSELLRMTMQRMVSSVPLTDLVRKVTSDNSGSRLGELREMIEVLLGTYKFELNVFRSAVNVFHHDVHDMHYKNRCLRRSGSTVSTVMQIPLNNSSIILYNSSNVAGRNFLEKTATDNCCILKLGSDNFGGATRAIDYNGHYLYESLQQQRNKNNENGLANAMSKLRSRRGGGKAETKSRIWGSSASVATSSGLNLMTTSERKYTAGEQTAIDFGERYVGILGDAEHRGRLMSFM